MKVQFKVRFNYNRWAGTDYAFDNFIDAFNFAALWNGQIVITENVTAYESA